MNSGYAELSGPSLLAPMPARPARASRSRSTARKAPVAVAQPLTWCVLAVAILMEVAVMFAPQALALAPWQGSSAFKVASGYVMLTLLALEITFGWMRRLPAMARQHRKLNELHQLAGLVLLVLLAFHAAARPVGFLQCVFHAVTIGLAAGALRGLLGTRIGRRASAALLMLHIGLACLVCAAVLVHLYLVYTYTA